MTCPSELIWAAYVDDECPGAERAPLEAHLAGCPACRRLVNALGEENQLLAQVLGESPELEESRSIAWPAWGAAAAALAALAVGLHFVSDWFAGLGREAPAGFVDERRIVLGLLFDAVFYMLREGASMLESMLTTFVAPVLIALGGLVALSLRRRWAGGTLVLAAFLALPRPSSAIEIRNAGKGHDRVIVGASEILDDSLAASGDTVAVDGTISGNLFAAGRRVIVRGTVKGDLLAVANRIEIEGTVEGNVFGGAEAVIVRGSVGRSLYGGGTTLRIDAPGRVEGDLLGVAEDLDLDGRVGHDLVAMSERMNLRGGVGRDASLRVRHLHLEAPATIGGDLVMRVPNAADLQQDPGVVVSGKSETRIAPKEKSHYLRPSFYVWKLIWLVAAFVTGLALRALAPSLLPARLPAAGALLRAAGLGFVALVAVPAAAVLLMLTLVGLPIGALALAVWLAALYLAKILVATVVGRGLLQRADAPPAAFAPVLLVGLVCLTLASNLPYIDGLVRLVVLVLGLGLAVVGVQRGLRREAEA
jgi:cytoskeletal protein CcmA (bactofilin family)/predicted anti-sigma-YlaC factor YlaD